MKKIICLVLSAILLTGALTGCSNDNKKERESVTIAFWSDQLTEQYGAFLRDKFPEVDFTFYVAMNSADFYRFKDDCGDLPDILTVRRFAMRDIADRKDSLMDLSDTELANAFPQSYLRSYTYEDGTVNWLPTCAEVDSIIVNKTLLEENGISVPKNYNEFIEACDSLSRNGIRPFMSNFDADYTCMEVLQGLSAAALSSQEGREWRQLYESAQTNSLSDDVWLPVFERMSDFIAHAGLGSSDLEISYDDVFELYSNGEIAMMRGTGNDAERYRTPETESVLMPYFGDDENDNRYLTYPAFQIAASKNAEETPERKQLILDIMAAMLSEDGLRKISANQNMVSYSSELEIDMSPSMDEVNLYAESNRLYIRLASSDMFSVSQHVVQGMIRGEYADAKAALDAFNAELAKDKSAAETAAHIDKSYSYEFDPNGGSEAASAVMNSVREELGTELLIAPSVYVAGNIAAGDYTEEELRFLTMGEGVSVIVSQITGEQLYKYVDYMLTTPEKRGSVINDSTLYVSSGFEMSVKKTDSGYELERLTVNGNELDKEKTYSAALLGNLALMMNDALKAAGITEYDESDDDYKRLLTERLIDGRQLSEPSKYIIVLQ
ncbi:MAG: ABC transporter substrate-binding protein [Clostridium sp.]|nr:ABC transporter substrate-binding protein [Clostridium sp.]MCM1547380.1 ABC transporter substrate-binding protein [Ruminococcus sp.]